MSTKKMGRPKSENPLSERIYIRVDKTTKEKLDCCTEKLEVSRSDVVRQGIETIYDKLQK